MIQAHDLRFLSADSGGPLASVAALYVAKYGVYWDRPDVEAWDEERDAREYPGTLPVVAHPPCQLWTNMTGVNYRRYAGARNRPANDGGCFCRALECVRAFGGVLEHPAGSWAWKTFALRRPERGLWVRDTRTGDWVTEVAQSAYGHPARKLTWLLYQGGTKPPALDWSVPSGTHQCGWFDRTKPVLGKNAALATPPAFADLLLSIARECKGSPQE